MLNFVVFIFIVFITLTQILCKPSTINVQHYALTIGGLDRSAIQLGFIPYETLCHDECHDEFSRNNNKKIEVNTKAVANCLLTKDLVYINLNS